ncbi:hypothetical protein HCZ87_05975 [Phaeobacter sp. HF9A]|nr:hypothetical protein [Phaeobacter sp. HF9A]
MAAYDRLPPTLRAWLREANLPWSPRSCHRIWQAARNSGMTDADALARLDAAEARTLARTGQR